MRKLKLTIVVGLLIIHPNLVTAGDAGMQQLFDDIGAYGNATAPGAYKAQGMNIVTGGSLFMRVPTRNYQLANVQLPSLKLGCGGIDLTAGSFSFISKDQFVAMMKNIGSNAVAYAFKLSLDSISPQINKTLTDLQTAVQEINNMNINSCEAGEAIARGMTGNYQATAQYFAKVGGPFVGLYNDAFESSASTRSDNSKTDSAISAINDTNAQPAVKPGNVVWRALSQLPGLDTQDKYLLMSMTGTVIVHNDKQSSIAPTLKLAKPITLTKFIHGDDAAGSKTTAKIEVYACRDALAPNQCLELTDNGSITITPYVVKVRQKLTAIADKFQKNQKLTTEEISFVNITNIPVYKALAVTSSVKNLGLDEFWISKYADLIASEYAYQFIYQSAHQIQTALTNWKLSSNAPVGNELSTMEARLKDLKKEARSELVASYEKVQSVNQIAQEVVFMERTLQANLPTNLLGNLRFAQAGR